VLSGNADPARAPRQAHRDRIAYRIKRARKNQQKKVNHPAIEQKQPQRNVTVFDEPMMFLHATSFFPLNRLRLTKNLIRAYTSKPASSPLMKIAAPRAAVA